MRTNLCHIFRLKISRSLIKLSKMPNLWLLLVEAFLEVNWPVHLATEVPHCCSSYKTNQFLVAVHVFLFSNRSNLVRTKI